MDISAKTKEHPENVTVSYEVPDSLADLVAAFGEEVVATNAKGSIVISLQAFIRRHIDKPQEEVQALVSAWKPDTRAGVTRKSAAEKVGDLVGKLSDEERAELLRKLTA